MSAVVHAPDDESRVHHYSPIISIWGCTTLAWLLEAITVSDIRGGFLPRFWFVAAGERGQPMPLPPPPDPAKQMALLAWLRQIQQLEGIMTLSPDAREFYERWYLEVEARPYPEFLLAFRGRYQTLVLKLAVLEHLAENISMTISVAAMRRACRHIDMALVALARINRDEFQFDRATADQMDSRGLRAGVTDHAQIMRETRLLKTKMDMAIATLLESEQIGVQESPRNDKRGGRPKRRYFLLP